MKDIFDDYQSTLIDIIIDFLKAGDMEKLQGLQCFDSAIEYTGIQGMESLLNTLFIETKRGAQEAKEIRKKIASVDIYDSHGTADRMRKDAEMREKGYVDITTIDSACDGIRRLFPMLDWLQTNGLLGGYAEYGSSITHLFLPKEYWGTILDKIVLEGEETKVFGSAMGKLLALAYNNRGFRSLVPLILACNKTNSKGEIPSDVFLEQCCTAISRPQRFYANMIERDSKKNKAIKAILYSEDGKLLLNPNAVHVVEVWRVLAERRAHSRSVGE